jgi:hemolysin III
MSWPSFREPVSAWTHLFWLLLAIPATWVLWRRAPRRVLERFGVQAFSFGLVVCYAGSWLFHAVPEEVVRPFRTADHIGIYLLIAGTVTPIGLVVLSGWWRTALVGGIWLLGFLGIGLRLSADLSLGTLTALYLFMGWVGCLTYFELARRLGHARMRPLWIGGLFYSAGAVLNGLHWPVLVPGLVESHEVFHLLVMAGTAWHYYFIYAAVLPYRAAQPGCACSKCAVAASLDRAEGPAPAERPRVEEMEPVGPH